MKLQERKLPRGKMGERVRLATEIQKEQDKRLSQLVEATGRTKTVLVGEALQVLFSEYEKMGVI